MRAVVYDRYGPPDVQRLAEVERPVPKEDEVLVKIHATAVTRADCATREANRRSGLAVSLISRLISGIRRPKQRILGTEFAGDVEAVGTAVKEFAVGDQVFGTSGTGRPGRGRGLSIAVIAHGRFLPGISCALSAAASP